MLSACSRRWDHMEMAAALQRGLNAMHLEDAAEVKASSCWGSDSSRDSTKVCV